MTQICPIEPDTLFMFLFFLHLCLIEMFMCLCKHKCCCHVSQDGCFALGFIFFLLEQNLQYVSFIFYLYNHIALKTNLQTY